MPWRCFVWQQDVAIENDTKSFAADSITVCWIGLRLPPPASNQAGDLPSAVVTGEHIGRGVTDGRRTEVPLGIDGETAFAVTCDKACHPRCPPVLCAYSSTSMVYTAQLPVPYFSPRRVCTDCGTSAEVAEWLDQPERESVAGKRWQ